MLHSSLLYIPVNDTTYINKKTIIKNLSSTSKRETRLSQKKLYEETLLDEIYFEKDFTLSKKQISSFLPNKKQEMNTDYMDITKKKNDANLSVKKRNFEDELKVSSKDEIQNAVYKKIKISPENQTTKSKAFLQPAAVETLHDEENSQNMEVLQIADRESTFKTRERSSVRRSTRNKVLSKNDYKVLVQNKKTQVGLREKRKISSKQSLKKTSFKKEETKKIAKKKSKRQSMKKKLMKHSNKKEEVSLKIKMKNVLDVRPRKRGRPSKKELLYRNKEIFDKQQRKIDNTSQNQKNISSYKANSSLANKLRKRKVNYTDPVFHEPFKYGWKREVVYRAYTKQARADVYYYTPEGKKLRSLVAIKAKLHKKELTPANFTFHRGSVGIADSEKEIIRHSTRIKKCATMAQQIKGHLLKTVKKNEVLPFQENNLSTGKNNCDQIDNFKDVSESSASTSMEVNKEVHELNKDNLDISTKNIPTAFEKQITSHSDKKNVVSCENILNTTFETADEKTTSIKSDIKITGSNKSHNNFHSTTSIMDDSTQKVESLPDVLHVQSSSTYPDTLTTTIGTSEKYFSTKTRNKNVELSVNINKLPKSFSDKIHNIKNHSSLNANNLKKGTLIKMELVPYNESEKENDSFYQESFFTHIEENIDNFMKENLSHKRTSKLQRIQNNNPENNFSSKNSSLAIQENNRTLESSIARKTLSDKTDLNHQISEAMQLNSIQNINKTHQSALLPKRIVNNVEIKTQICMEEPVNSFINPMLSKTVLYTVGNISVNNEKTECKSYKSNSSIITSTNQSSPLRLNHSALKRIKFNLLETPVYPHSMVSFCTGFSALKLIFSYLNIKDLLIARKVCKVWKELADQPILWKKVQINNTEMTDTLAFILQKQGTKHIVVIKKDDNWKALINAIPKIKCLRVLELFFCPAIVLEKIVQNCPRLQIVNNSPSLIKYNNIEMAHTKSTNNPQRLYLNNTISMSFVSDLAHLFKFINLTYLSIRSIKDLGKKNIEVVRFLKSLKILELDDCSEFNAFGSTVLQELKHLKRLRLEKILDSHCCIDILINVSKLEKLTDLELVNIIITTGFEYLPKCQNVTRLKLFPIYEHPSAISNNIILKITAQFTKNLKHFIWGITDDFLEFLNLFYEYSEDDFTPVFKPNYYFESLEKLMDLDTKGICRKQFQIFFNILGDNERFKKQTVSKTDTLPLTNLRKLYSAFLPETKLEILRTSAEKHYSNF